MSQRGCSAKGRAASLSEMKPAVIVLLITLLAACDGSPVVWTDPTPMSTPPRLARLVLSDAGEAAWVTEPQAQLPPPVPGECGASMRLARAGTDVYAVWWAVRPDSTARVVVAVSHNGGTTWTPSVAVDTADVSARGCDRPSPSIAATGADVHVVYAMRSAEGTGVFLAHSMDRGAMFHAPIPVSYGDRLVETAVAADGQVVAVAYEEPSGAPDAVRLALSRSQGHIVEVHMPASRAVDGARSPRVAIAVGRVAVAWTVRDQRGGEATMVRVGAIEP